MVPSRICFLGHDNEREYIWETLKLLRDEIQKLKEGK
jgi:hypothetical protein